MKKLIFLIYLILSIHSANGQQAITTNPDVDLQLSDQSGGLFYNFYQGSTSLESKIGRAEKIILNTGSGDLKAKRIKGNKIIVKARVGILATNIKKAEKYMHEEMIFSLDHHGEYIELNSFFSPNNGDRGKVNPISFLKTPAKMLDLLVFVPDGIEVVIDDKGGDIIIDGLNNNMNITDGGGDIKILSSNGNMFIRDGAGDLLLSGLNHGQIKSNIKIKDQAGDIRIEDIKSVISIDDDSGDIRIEDVVGNVSIDDFAGDIRVRSVKGDLVIADTSGDINTKRISGNVIYDDASGDITIADIGKDVTIIEEGSGDVYIKNVIGHVNR